jgi:hypothetical protein
MGGHNFCAGSDRTFRQLARLKLAHSCTQNCNGSTNYAHRKEPRATSVTHRKF